MARRNTDWQVGPNLKPQAGSQGTLFRGNQGISDERYPRGYTPERQKEIANAVGGNYARGEGLAASYYRDHAYVDTSGTSPTRGQVIGRANNLPKRRLVDNIARSTVPVEHLQPKPPAKSLSFWTGDSLDSQHDARGSAGFYDADPPGHMGTRNDIHVKTDYVAGGTPIHEIGHHVSNLEGNVHSATYARRIPQHRGTEEGYADAYMHEHFRDRRGKQMEGVSHYPASHYYPNDYSRQQDFRGGYEAARSHVPAPDYKYGGINPVKSIQTDSPTFNSLHRYNQPGLFSIQVSGPPSEEKFGGFIDSEYHPEKK